jgi:hypothetical protein
MPVTIGHFQILPGSAPARLLAGAAEEWTLCEGPQRYPRGATDAVDGGWIAVRQHRGRSVWLWQWRLGDVLSPFAAHASGPGNLRLAHPLSRTSGLLIEWAPETPLLRARTARAYGCRAAVPSDANLKAVAAWVAQTRAPVEAVAIVSRARPPAALVDALRFWTAPALHWAPSLDGGLQWLLPRVAHAAGPPPAAPAATTPAGAVRVAVSDLGGALGHRLLSHLHVLTYKSDPSHAEEAEPVRVWRGLWRHEVFARTSAEAHEWAEARAMCGATVGRSDPVRSWTCFETRSGLQLRGLTLALEEGGPRAPGPQARVVCVGWNRRAAAADLVRLMEQHWALPVPAVVLEDAESDARLGLWVRDSLPDALGLHFEAKRPLDVVLALLKHLHRSRQ